MGKTISRLLPCCFGREEPKDIRPCHDPSETVHLAFAKRAPRLHAERQ